MPSLMTDLAKVILDNGAPILSALLSNAGMGVPFAVLNLIAQHFGVKDTQSFDQIKAAIMADPIKLRELELNHQQSIVDALASIVQTGENRTNNDWVLGFVMTVCVLAIFAMIWLAVVRPH